MKGADVVVDCIRPGVCAYYDRLGVVDQPFVSVVHAPAPRDLSVAEVLQPREVHLHLLRTKTRASGVEDVCVVLVRALGIATVPLVTVIFLKIC